MLQKKKEETEEADTLPAKEKNFFYIKVFLRSGE